MMTRRGCAAIKPCHGPASRPDPDHGVPAFAASGGRNFAGLPPRRCGHESRGRWPRSRSQVFSSHAAEMDLAQIGVVAADGRAYRRWIASAVSVTADQGQKKSPSAFGRQMRPRAARSASCHSERSAAQIAPAQPWTWHASGPCRTHQNRSSFQRALSAAMRQPRGHIHERRCRPVTRQGCWFSRPWASLEAPARVRFSGTTPLPDLVAHNHDRLLLSLGQRSHQQRGALRGSRSAFCQHLVRSARASRSPPRSRHPRSPHLSPMASASVKRRLHRFANPCPVAAPCAFARYDPASRRRRPALWRCRRNPFDRDNCNDLALQQMLICRTSAPPVHKCQLCASMTNSLSPKLIQLRFGLRNIG